MTLVCPRRHLGDDGFGMPPPPSLAAMTLVCPRRHPGDDGFGVPPPPSLAAMTLMCSCDRWVVADAVKPVLLGHHLCVRMMTGDVAFARPVCATALVVVSRGA
jgi:hypothetical protein